MTWEWHREHCLFMWRKLHRSLLVYGGGGDVLGDEGAARGNQMMVDGCVCGGLWAYFEVWGEFEGRGGD